MSDHRVEDLSQRTETTQVFANPDGTWSSETAPGPVRVQGDDGTWSDIDLTLVPVDGGVAPKAALGDVVLSDGGDKTFASATVDGKDLAWKWPTTLPSPVIEGNTATYKDAVDGGDLVVTATNAGFRQDIVLHQAPTSPVSFQTPVVTDGAVLKENPAGGLTMSTGNGDELVSAPAPVMYDASEDSLGNPDNVKTLDTSVTKTSQGAVVTLDPAESFLQDPSTQYPVTIDPSYTSYASLDTWVSTSGPTAVHPHDEELVVGTNNGGTYKYRSFLLFPNTPWDNTAVSSATLTLRNFDATTCSGSAVQVVRITEAWNNGTANWNNQPSATSSGAANSSQAYGASGCPGADMNWNVSTIVKSWATNASTNYGFRIAGGTETANASFRKFRSTDYYTAAGSGGLRPRLTVNYNHYPNTPSALTIDGLTNGYVTTATPKFTATVTDPDGASVKGFFKVYDGSTLVWSGSGSTVTSGGRSTVTVPSGKLTNGKLYKVVVYGDDGNVYSGKDATSGGYVQATYTVDTTKPNATVTSSAYTNGQWLVTPPSSNTFSLNGDADVTSFTIEKDGVVSTVAANASGDASVSWNPNSGAHVLKVTAVDKAGNKSAAAVSFSFGTGPAEFSQPNVAERSTSTFPVNIGGPPNATSATLSWRVAGTTTWNPATSVTKASGGTWTGSVAASGSGSTSGDLVWDATSEPDPATDANLAAPALLEVRACFTYAGGGLICTDPRQIQLVPSAFGGNFPVAAVGPAQVALFTGEMSLSAVDASDATAGFGRTFSSFDDTTVTAGVFGPGWSDTPMLTASSDASATVIDNRAKDGTLIIVDTSGGSQVFVPKAGSSTNYVPLEQTGDATTLTYSPGTSASLELSRPLGTGSVTTSWTLAASDTGGDPAWVLDSVNAPGGSNDVAVSSEAQRPTWIRESDPSASATCTEAREDIGCRALTVAYSGSGASTRVASVARTIGASSQASVTSTMIATYSYDGSGKLTSACGPVPGPGKSALCSTYDYATVDGRTVISQMTSSNLKPWRFDYTSTGKLLTVKRERPGGGDATWSVDYGLAVDSAGLPDMSQTATVEWGQQTAPVHVFAVYEPTTGVPDVSDARLYYTRDDGTLVNTAEYGTGGWSVDTHWYDTSGNIIQELDGAGWSRVHAKPVSDRPAEAANASAYTIYNTWGNDSVKGARVVDEYGPAHTATLEDGTTGMFRTHTSTMYDDDPNVDAALVANRPGSDGLGLVVKETFSVSDAARTNDYDAEVTKFGYDPIVAGDGNGWTLGSPTTVSAQVDAGTWSTQTTRFDSSGSELESRDPGGAADSSHAGNDAHATVTTYYSAAGSGDCGGKPTWDGLVCKVGPAGQPSGAPVPVRYNASFNDGLLPTEVREISDGVVTRTTTVNYDAIDRMTDMTKTTSGPGVTHDTIATAYEYDDAGLLSSVSSGTETLPSSYDSWGRVTSTTNSVGASSSFSYDAAGDVATYNDGSGTYAFDYDSHKALTRVSVGGGVGSFDYTYTPAGDIDTVTYPNGVVGTRRYDEIGTSTGLTYSQGSTDLLAFSSGHAVDGTTLASESAASAQTFDHDGLGRLVKVEDVGDGGCTTRVYGFDDSSNRGTFRSYGPDAGSDCQATTPAIDKSSTYDSAGRIRDTGYTYDNLGRTLTTPQPDAGPNAAGELDATYRANDMVASLTQSVATSPTTSVTEEMTYSLDPLGRVEQVVTKTAGTESKRLRYLYSGTGDAPSSVDESTTAGTSWTSTRYVSVPGARLVAATSDGSTAILLGNMTGDVVASMDGTAGTATVASYGEFDEYGNRLNGTLADQRYGWLGSFQRSSDALGGLVLMGARLSNPSTGSFLSADPVKGGNVTAYTYPQSPVDNSDISGKRTQKKYDSKIPTYDYWRIWFNKRETYKIAYWNVGAGLVATAAGVIAAVAGAVVTGGVLGMVAVLAGFIVWKAQDAEHDGKCLAVKLYVQRKKFGISPPGPDMYIGNVYKTSYHCTGSYTHG